MPRAMNRGSWLAVGVAVLLGACGDATQPEDVDVFDSTQENLMKGTAGAHVGDADYCDNAANKCALGEGDCDSSAQCSSGLVCVAGNLAKRGATSGDACAPAHCGDGTKNSDETSIDCGGSCGSDCAVACDAPNGNASKCSSDCPCTVGEGDCDGASECQPGLGCGSGNGPAFQLPAGTDVCWGTTCQNSVKDGDETAPDCGGSCAPCAPPAAANLALASVTTGALLPIVIAPHGDPNTHAAIVAIANDLRDKLNAIKGATGTAFTVAEPPTNIPSGISLGIDGDFPNTGWPYQGVFRPGDTLAGGVLRPDRLGLKEQYVLSTPQGSNRLIIAGATVDGLRAAVWDLLGKLGYRHYFPTPTWEVIPHDPTVTVPAQSANERPGVLSRTLNFPGNAWETSFHDTTTLQLDQWRKHNRLYVSNVNPTTLGTPTGSYGAVVTWWQNQYGPFPSELSTDPSRNQFNRQFCLTGVANVGGTQWTVESVVKAWAQAQTVDKLALSPNTNVDWTSALKLDGSLNCNDVNHPTYNNIANRMAAILNAAAEAQPTKVVTATLRYDFAGAPTLALRQNVIANIHAHAGHAPFALENRVGDWGKAGLEVGLTDYLGPNTDDIPGKGQLSTQFIVDRIQKFYGLGVRRYDLDVMWGFGASGPTWWAMAQAFWEVDNSSPRTAPTLRADFLTNAFGPAATAMDAYYKVMEGRALWSDNLVGVQYRALQEAFSITTDQDHPAIRARLADLAVYTRYLELSRKLWNRCDAQGSATEQSQLRDVLRFAYATRDRRILESRDAMTDIMTDIATCPGGVEATTGAACDLPEWNVACPTSTQTTACGTCFGNSLPPSSCNAMKNGTAPSQSELITIVNTGASNVPILNPALMRPFSSDLVPYSLTPTLPARLASIYTIGQHHLFFQRPSAADPLVAHVRKYSPSQTIAGRLSLAASPESPIDLRFFTGTEAAMETDWVFGSASGGVHRLDLDDQNGRMFTTFPTGTRVAVPVGPNDPPLALNYRWAGYMFVPAGTANVVGWSQGDGTFFRYIKNGSEWVQQPAGYLSDFAVGDACTSPYDIATGGRGGLWDHFVIPINPPAPTDELWLFNDGNGGTVGERVLLSVPPYLYQSPEGLLVPREVSPEGTNPTTCSASSDCQSGQYCSQGGQCRSDGGGCTTTSQCASGQACHDGACDCASCEPGCSCGPGGTCDADEDCRSGVTCVAGICQNCAIIGCEGATCSSDGFCASGLACLSGQCVLFCSAYPEAAECVEALCSNGIKDTEESDVDCGGPCAACQTGDLCTADSDCAAGLACGTNNAGCFDGARAERVCWPAQCQEQVSPEECGQPNSPCGPNCACVKACDQADPNSDCPPGESCKAGIAVIYNSDAPGVCVAEGCPSDDPTLCGGVRSLCGNQCICTPDCSAATAEDPDDQCGGICPHLCPMGQTCCTTDLNCPISSFCQAQPNGLGICRPDSCAYKHLTPPLCGSPIAPCGEECPACTVECSGRQCGLDPACGVSCGTCGGGDFCNGSGQCEASGSGQPPLVVHDSDGEPIDIPVLPPTPTTPVGAVDGKFSVSDEGSAQYSVPISVPPGRAGIEPVLSLRYGGTKASGEAGIGWKLEGLSQITRCTRTYALDGYAAPIKNDTSDRFCLDGKRLEMVSGSAGYGGDGTEYRTLIDSFNKIRSLKDPSAPEPPFWSGIEVLEAQQRGPDYFEVRTKDGRKLTYGRTRDALLIGRNGLRVSWLLSRVEDRSGNSMIVRYYNLRVEVPAQAADKVPNMVVPQAIFYTGHSGTEGDREVRFDYEPRLDTKIIYGQGGVPLLSGLRLKRVTTFVKGAPVKNYRLDYESEQLSLVRKIFECPSDVDVDSQCKPPTEFEYQQESGFTFSQLPVADIAGAGQLDMNGDGYPDFLIVTAHVGDQPDLGLGWKIAFIVVDVGLIVLDYVYPPAGVPAATAWTLGRAPLKGALTDGRPVTFTGDVLQGTGNRVNPLTTIYDVQGLPCQSGSTAFLDYDQDGKDDVVGSCFGSSSVFVSRSLGDGNFAARNTVASLPPQPWSFSSDALPWPTLYDVNGDGLHDIVSCVTRSKLEVRLRLGPAENFGEAITLASPEIVDPNNSAVLLAARLPFCGDGTPTGQAWDVDGDGTGELLVRYQPNVIDNLVFGKVAGWYTLRYSTTAPRLRFELVELPDTGDSATGRAMQAADLNGDGLLDIWRPGDVSGNLQAPEATVWLNSGSGFLASTVHRPVPVLTTPELASPSARLSTTLFVDHNADTRLDILEHWVGGQFGSEYNVVLHPDGSGRSFTANFPNDLTFVNEVGLFPGRYGAVGDIDADGNPDLFGKSNQAWYGSGLRNMLLSKVKDGLGNITKIQYSGAPYKGTCSEPQQWPVRCIKNMKGLVSSHTEGFADSSGFSGEIDERFYSYTYENARVDLTGHGWLGFDKRTVSETVGDQSKMVTVQFEPVRRFKPDGIEATNTTPPYLYPLVGMPAVTTIDETAGFGQAQSVLEDAAHSRRTVVTQFWDVQMSAQSRPFPVLRASQTQSFSRRVPTLLGEVVPFSENGVERTRCWDRNFEIDTYANVEHNLKYCELPRLEYVLEELRTRTTFQPNADEWLISTPDSVTITSRRPDAFKTQHYSLQHDVQGLLHVVTRDPTGDAQRVVYTRDSEGFGTIERITEEVGTGEAARIIDIGYEPDYYFPSSLTEHVGSIQLTSQFAFEPNFGQLASAADPNGVSIQHAYDAFGKRTDVISSSGTTHIDYAALPFAPSESLAGTLYPRLQVTIDSESWSGGFGGHSVQQLDNYGRLVRSSTVGFDAEPVISERAFDGRGRLAGATAPHLEGAVVIPKQIYTYDYLDRVTRVENADGTFGERQYASGVSLASEHEAWIADLPCASTVKGLCGVDIVRSIGTHDELDETDVPKENVTITNHAGLVVRTIDGENVANTAATSNFEYAPFNRLRRLRDNGGAQTTFDYDDYGRLLTHSDPDGGDSTFTYNGFGEIKTSLDANGVGRAFEYDTLGRLTSIIDSAGPSQWVSSQWIYDQGDSALGRISETISPPTAQGPEGHRVVYSYEPITQQQQRGLLSSLEYVLDGTSHAVGMQYDDLGRPELIRYPTTSGDTPVVAKYHYQLTSGALERVTEIGSGEERPIWQLDDAFQGHVASQVTFGNGAISTFGYDSARRWLSSADTTLNGTSIQSLEYTHYNDGRVRERTTPTRTQEYTYDPLGRLKTLTNFGQGQSSAPHSFDHDSHGNLTQNDITVSDFQNPARPHLPTLVGGNAYSYYANGNLLSRGGVDVPGQLQTFAYTPFDLPREISTGSTNPHVTAFEYSADEERVVRRDPDFTRYYVGDLYQHLVDPSGATNEERFRISAGGTVVAEIVRSHGGEKVLYLHSDHLGTPSTISDDEGNVAHQEYGPFGALQGTPAFISFFGTHLGFTGHQQDFDLGLTDMGGRVFDPLAGRFTTADPIMQAPFFSQGQNRYAYVLNDPINLIDPTGMAFDTSGDVFAQGHIVGDSFTALSVGGIAAVIGYGIGSAVADSGVSLSSLSPPTPGNGASRAVAVYHLVEDVSDLFWPSGPDHSGNSSRIVHAPSAAPRSSAFKPRAPQAKGNNRGGPPVPRPDPACDAECMNAPNGAQAPSVPNRVLEDPAMKGNPNAAAFFDDKLGWIGTGPFGPEAWLAKVGGIVVLRALPGALKLGKHHIFPQQFRKFFASRGIDIDKHTLQIAQDTTHAKGVHGKGLGKMPGRWNQRWKEWMLKNPKATATEIYQFGGKLMDEYGLSHLPIVPW